MPQETGRHRRKRVTEDATASRIAEAEDVWHSTAIDDSRFNAHLENLPSISSSRASSKKRSVPTLQEQNADSRRKGSKDPENDRARKALPGPAPIVINPPSGHSFFSSVLQKCGYVIRQPVSNNEMFYDVMHFRKNLSDWLVENEDEMKRIETDTSKFFKALDAYLSEKSNFISSMKPTRHETELIQPSLLHSLLGIDALQPKVLKIVMPVLGEASFSTAEEDTTVVTTILNQLKWLPGIVEGQKFTDDLLSIIDTAVYTCQSQIIKLLPDILPSNLHQQVAEKLLVKFNDEALQLNIALMDCFSSLDISEGFWSDIRSTAINQMANASLRDIPAYLSFLFREENSSALNEVISTIREKVTLIQEDRSPNNDAYQVEILEKIGFCVTVNPDIAKLWTKQVKEDLQHTLLDQIKKIDFIMLLVFMDSHNKQSLNALKLFLAEKKHAVSLFTEVMDENRAMVYHLFGALSKILDSFLRTRDSKCLDSVCEIMVKLFAGLSSMEAQTLMGNMTSILINHPPSRDIVLRILIRLSEKEPNKLLLFAPYLMSVLECVMQFPARQIRDLMNILAILSQTEGRSARESNHFSSEFSILLRKQLTHSDLKIRCFGVFGALATVRHMAEQTIHDEERMEQLLKLAWSMVERDEDACCIFFDELSTCIESLPVDISRPFRDELKTKFQNLWTHDTADNSHVRNAKQRKSLNLVPEFDANRECSTDRIQIAFENKPLEMSPLVIPAHLRILAKLENKLESGNLVGIDAILGCPLLLPSLEEYYLKESLANFSYNQRQELGKYLVLAINFFRESVCAFINDKNTELRIKIWLRLENILKLQTILVKHFDQFPNLPQAYVAEKTIGLTRDGAGPSGLKGFRQANAGASKANDKKKGPRKKSARKKARRDDVVDFEDSEDDSNAAPAAAATRMINANLSENIQPKRLLPHLRRLDSFVFQLLRYPLQCEGQQQVNFSTVLMNLTHFSQSSTAVASIERLIPETLTLILSELKHQINDDSSKLKILEIRRILKHICTHINTISETLIKNEESEESNVSTEQQNKLECCLRLLMEILSAYMDAIKKLDREEKDTQTMNTVHLLAKQVTKGKTQITTESELKSNMAEYLGGLSSIIKSPTTALDHMKLIKNAHDLLDGDMAIKKKIDEVVKVYLRTDWKMSSAQVDGFLKIWLSTSPASVKVVKNLARKLLDLQDDTDKYPNSATYKSCTETNFHVWYSSMLSALSQHAYKNLRRRGDFEDSLGNWMECVDIFKMLVAVSKKIQKNVILLPLLRHSRLFLDAFISGGAGLLPQFWKEDSKRAQTFCKDLQIPCRTLQYICEHSKVHSDLQLLKSVPLIKRVLETLVFRIREVLAVHGAANAFELGSLKHRDLRGDCIHSQIIAEDDLLFSTSDDDSDEDVRAAPLSDLAQSEEEEQGGMNEDSMDVDGDF